jgi:broad specificity phosphatase PhoE
MKEVHVYLTRHSESVMQVEGKHLVGGRSNETPLSTLGVRQSFVLGRYIAEHMAMPDLVFASPAVRTMTTARIALRAIGLVRYPHVDGRLQELSQGEATGQPRDIIYTPATLRRIELEGLDFKQPGGQSVRELGQEGVDWLDDAYEQYIKDSDYAYVFTHGYKIRAIAGKIEGWDHTQIHNADVANASITTIAGYPGNWRVAEYAASTQLQDSDV